MWEDIEQAEKVKVYLEQLYKKERQLKKVIIMIQGFKNSEI